MSLSQRWNTQLDHLRAQGRYRRLLPGCGVDFSSNDYLGYGSGARRPLAFTSATPLPRSGMASRLLRGQHELWEEVESRLAKWHGGEAALVFPTGYAANEGLLATIIEPGDWVASDELNHASLIDGLRLSKAEKFVFHHSDLNHLEIGLSAAAKNRPAQRQLFIIAESLFGMDGDQAPLVDFANLAQRYDAHLILDEAHATGCYGKNGSGLVNAAGLRNRVLATVHTGGKGLALLGAYVCGSKLLKEMLVNRCRHFLFTTALPPIVAGWWLETLDLVEMDHEGRAALHDNAALFRGELELRGVPVLGKEFIVPIVLGAEDRALTAAERLQAQGWDIRAIRPPTVPAGSSRLRVSIHADHSQELLREVAAAIAEVLA